MLDVVCAAVIDVEKTILSVVARNEDPLNHQEIYQYVESYTAVAYHLIELKLLAVFAAVDQVEKVILSVTTL
jgi:hypothetical protein